MEEIFSFKVIHRDKRSRALTKANFGCLTGLYTLNITMGCSFSCAYCYARAYPDAPHQGIVELFSNLPKLLERELSSKRRKEWPDYIILNTASDCFQPHPDILQITYEVMETLLKKDIGFSFLTKGFIPVNFIDLFKKYSFMIKAQIGLVSLSNKFWKHFEPGAASPEQRLENVTRLKVIGIQPEVRMDPIVPFLTDGQEEVDNLMRALNERGIEAVSLSYLHLRPAIMKQLEAEIPALAKRLLDACFAGQKWQTIGLSSKSKMIPGALRQKGYWIISQIAQKYGIKTWVCACKNPDLPGDICSAGRARNFFRGRQLSLFGYK